MWARATELHSSSLTELDADLDVFDSEVWPRVEAAPGSLGSVVLVDADRGRGLVVTLWDSEESMHDSRELAAHLRAVVAQRMNLADAPVAWEGRITRLNVPAATGIGG